MHPSEPAAADAAAEDAAAEDVTAAAKRTAFLRRELSRHESLYRSGEPEITDYEFDLLKRELDALLAQDDELFSATATATATAATTADSVNDDSAQANAAAATNSGDSAVANAANAVAAGLLPFAPGDDHAEGFAKAAHLAPMLSIANVYSDAEFHNLFITPLQKLLPPETPGLADAALAAAPQSGTDVPPVSPQPASPPQSSASERVLECGTSVPLLAGTLVPCASDPSEENATVSPSPSLSSAFPDTPERETKVFAQSGTEVPHSKESSDGEDCGVCPSAGNTGETPVPLPALASAAAPPPPPPLFVIEPKMDGISVSLTYEDGVFVRAVTRGRLGGGEGDDITRNVATIATLPRRLPPPYPRHVELRGEIYIPNTEFLRINAARADAGLPLYANPRNLASGTVKLLDPAETAQRKLAITLYGLGHCDPPAHFPALTTLRATLARWAMPATIFFQTAATPAAALDAIRALDTARHHFDFPTDGAVVKLNSLAHQAAAGATAHHYRWAIAYKFAPEQARTRLRVITLETGRTGVITPVAELDPVELSGSTISRATLHNADEVARKDIREGDTVVIEKAGEIIPQIVRVELDARPPGTAPFDFAARLAELGLDASRRPGEPFWCLNTPTPAQRRRQLRHFASKACLDIENLGPAIIEKLDQAGFVRTPADLFTLRREQLVTLEKFGEKSADNLLAALAAARRRPLWRLLHALGIPNVGMQTAKDLARHFRTLDALANARYGDYRRKLRGKDGSERTAEESLVFGVGEVVTRSLLTWFSSPENRDLLERLCAHGLNFSATVDAGTQSDADTQGDAPAQDAAAAQSDSGNSLAQSDSGDALALFAAAAAAPAAASARSDSAVAPPAVNSDDLFAAAASGGTGGSPVSPPPAPTSPPSAPRHPAIAGKTFVLTGTLSCFDRDAAREKIEAAGGRVSGSVSAKTHYLIAGADAGGKLAKARALGVPVLSEPEFLALFAAAAGVFPPSR